jgi:hypothetical protein
MAQNSRTAKTNKIVSQYATSKMTEYFGIASSALRTDSLIWPFVIPIP